MVTLDPPRAGQGPTETLAACLSPYIYPKQSNQPRDEVRASAARARSRSLLLTFPYTTETRPPQDVAKSYFAFQKLLCGSSSRAARSGQLVFLTPSPMRASGNVLDSRCALPFEPRSSAGRRTTPRYPLFNRPGRAQRACFHQANGGIPVCAAKAGAAAPALQRWPRLSRPRHRRNSASVRRSGPKHEIDSAGRA